MARLGPALFLFLTGLSFSAHAYVLPADFLCRLLADTRRIAPLSASFVLSRSEPNLHGEKEPSVMSERLFVKKPERMRWVRERGPSAITVMREGRVFVGEETKLELMPERSSLMPALLYPRGRTLDETAAALLQSLAAAGIDTGTVSFGRIGEQAAYIIGAKAWETTKPQVWLHKDKYWPLKWRMPARAGEAGFMEETRLLGWGEGPATHFPRAIEIYHDDTLVSREEVTTLQSTSDLPETLFDAGAARRRM